MAQSRVGFRWNGEAVEGNFAKLMVARMAKAAAYVEGQAKRKISILNPSPHKSPSATGEPPKVVTGRLRASITHAVLTDGSSIVGVVGTNTVYARRLELGFVGTDSLGRNVNQGPRPFLIPSVLENRRQIALILGGR